MKTTSWNSIPRVFFRFAPMGKVEKTRFERNWTTFVNHHFEWLFQAGQKAGLTNVVQLRSKRVFSTFPIGAKRKNTLRIKFHEVAFIPPFRVGFPSRAKSRVDERRPIAFQNAFFRLSPSGRNEKTPLGSNSTRSVSYHHFEWAFPSRAKSRLTNVVQLRSKRVFSTFPIGA